MSRVALIGDNSINYISNLIDIWNSGNCAVLLDKNIPFLKMLEMMKEANVIKFIVDKNVISNWNISYFS